LKYLNLLITSNKWLATENNYSLHFDEKTCRVVTKDNCLSINSLHCFAFLLRNSLYYHRKMIYSAETKFTTLHFFRNFFKAWSFPGLFFLFIFHKFSYTIQYYLVIICPLIMLPYLHQWWFPQLWNSPNSRARMTHSSRGHRSR